MGCVVGSEYFFQVGGLSISKDRHASQGLNKW